MMSTATMPDRAPGIEDPGRVSGAARERADPEVAQRAGGGRSPRSTSWRSWPPTPRLPMAKRVRCYAGRICIPAISWRGGAPAMLVRWLGWRHRGAGRAGMRARSKSFAWW
jgi:hypothetical protein